MRDTLSEAGDRKFLIAAALVAILAAIGSISCKEKDGMPATANTARISNASLEKLGKKSIFFAHQSVGYNILDGIRDLMSEDGRLKMQIVETTDASRIGAGVLAHSPVGMNEYPISKLEGFAKMMDEGVGKRADFAILKFCYIDFAPETDVEALFANYKGTLERLKSKYPSTTFIHTTVPLRVQQKGAKVWIKEIIGRPIWGEAENIARQKYNELVRRQYHGKESLFDLAAVESTYLEGSREEFEKNGIRYYALIREYGGEDGSHLGGIGRKIVAARLVDYLAGLVQQNEGWWQNAAQ